MNSTRPPLVVIAGPTASGKSALALTLAERNDGVVINADASQVYRDLRVLSARPSMEEEARVSHRLFGHIDGADIGYSMARWAEEARAVIADVRAAGRLPVLVGGSGLYIRTLIEGIAPVPPVDPAVRAAVRAATVAANYVALTEEDPAAAARLNPRDTTRVARALEVVRSTGRPLAAWQVDRQGGIGEAVDLHALVMLPPREWLFDRVSARTDAMLRDGALHEVEALLARGDIPRDAPVMKAIGVREIIAWAGEDAPALKIIPDLRLATLQYAKRQYTWFRNQPPARWQRTDVTDTSKLSSLIETMLRG